MSLSDLTWLGGAVLGNDRQWYPKMLSLDGLEMIAVLVVMGLFIKVLEQFGMFEPVGGEGNGFSLRFVVFYNRSIMYEFRDPKGVVGGQMCAHTDTRSGPSRWS